MWTRVMHRVGHGPFLGLGAVLQLLSPGRRCSGSGYLRQLFLPWSGSASHGAQPALRPGMLNQHKVK